MGDIVITPASNDVNSTAGTLVVRASDLNPISLRTNDVNRLYIDPTGSVGIGTTVPTGGLHINYAPGAFSEALRLQRNNGIFYSVGLDTNFLNIAYNGNVNANNVLVLTNAGYLGVGNLQNALFNLDVASTQGKGIQLRFDATTGYRAQIIPYWNTNTDSRIDFAINRVSNLAADVIMSVGYDNNVGIGTVQPSQKLDVRGNIKLGADNAGNYVYYVTDIERTIIRTTRSDVTQQGLFRSDGWGNFTADKSIGIGYSLGSNFSSNSIGNGNLYVANTVGINTTSPTSKLNVVETTAIGTRIQLGTNSENALMDANKTVDMLILNAPYGTNSATTSNAGAKWGIKFVGSLEAGQINTTGKTSAIYAVSEDVLGYNRGTSLAFYTNQFNDIPYAEKMRIYHNGNIGIGITNPTNKVHISGGGISFTTSTGLAVPMLGIVLPTNIAYIGPYTTSTDGNAPTVVAFNQGSSVQQTWFYASGRISMVLNRQGRLHIGDNNNAPNCLLSVGPTNSTLPDSGICFGNDAQANIYRSSEDQIKTDGSFVVTNTLVVGGGENGVRILKNGSDSISSTLYLANAGNTRAYNFQQNAAGTNLDFWTYNSSNSWQNSLSFNYNGNIGIATTSPNTKLRVNGSFSQRASGNTAIQEYKNIVAFNLDGNGNGGYVIKTPFRLGSSYEMVILHVKGYGYGTATLYDFKIVFYDYAPSHQPVNYSLVDLGNDGSPKFLAKDADNYVQVCFGNTTDVNNYYFRFTVDCITTRNDNDYSQGWAMYQTSSANFGFASTGVYLVNSPVNFRTSNYVGIGTTNPVQKLQIEGVVGNPAFVGTTQSGIFRISNISDNAVLDFGLRPGGLGAWIQSTDETSLATNYPLLLNPNGANVGIGTTNPTQKLDIVGSYAAPDDDAGILKIRGAGVGPTQLNFGVSADGGYGWIQATDIAVTNNKNIILNPLDGNVGIGSTNPSGKLHVAGNIFLSANLIGNDGTRGYLLGKDSVSAGRVYLILDPNAANGIGVGSDYLYIAQENTTGVISNSAGPLLLNPGGGSVGIGTTNAVAQFHIGGTASNNNPWAVLDIADTYFKRIVFSEERVAYGITAYGGYIGYDANANTVSLGTYNNSSENRSINILRDNGNVGIGITNPTYTLQVAGTFYVNSTSFFNGAMTVEDSLTVDGRLNGSDGIALLKMRAGNSAGSWNDVNLQYEKTSSIDSLYFNMGGSTIDSTVKLTVQNNGNIGIGTTRPAGLLHVFNTTGRYINYAPGSVSGLVIQKNASVSSQGTTVLTLANAQGMESLVDRGTSLNLDIGYGGTTTVGGTIARGARIAALNHNAYDATAANQNAYLSFYTATGGTLTERVRIKGDGNVGIGTTSIGARLVVLGEVQVASNSAYTTHLNYGDIGLNFITTANGGATYFRGSTNGVTAMTVNGAGTVGIGIASPATILGVGGAGSTTAASGITFGADSFANLYRDTSSRLKTDGAFRAGDYISATTYLQASNGYIYPGSFTTDLRLNVGNAAGSTWDTYPVVIKKGTYVGIGTDTPTGKLHVVSSVAGETVLRADGTNGTLFSVVDNLSDSLMSVNNSAGLPVLEVFADDKVVMGQYASGDFVLVNNKIGIGTTNPNNKLSVIGGASIGSTTYNTAAPTNGLLVQGNVGIGLTNPSVKLEVLSSAVTIANLGSNQTSQLVYLGNSSATSYSDLIIRANDGQAEFFRAGNGYGSWGGASSLNIYNSNGPIAFHPNNTANSMFLSTGGNLGIGETSPDYKLTVHNRSSVSSNSDIEIVCGGAGQASLRMFEDNSGTHTVYGARVYYEGAGNNFFNIATIDGGTETIGFTLNRSSNVGIGTITPAEKLDVRGGLIRSNARVTNDQGFPVGHHSAGETVFEIDPTWSQLELQKYFNSTSVTWVAVADAPGGYCIYIDGAVNAGGFAGSGFPYIPVDTNDIFYMECWIQNVGTAQGHYMGSQDFDQSFSSLGGNPGSYGYWVMSNYNPTTTWTKVSGYISGFSSLSADVGKFKTGTKYWTPQALFNYTAGTGTRACRISGWKVIKVYQVGDRSFAGSVNVAADLYVADELGVGVPIANKRLNYGAQINAASASIQLVLGRTATSTGQGAIGADDSNTFAVYNVSGGAAKQFSVTQQGDVGVGNTTPTSRLTVVGPALTTNTKNTYAAAIGNANNTDLTFGADGSYAYIQSWGSKPLYINNQGNNVIVNANVGIGLTNPSYRLDVTGGDINFASNSILRFGTVAVLNEASNANDIYANIRVIRNYSSVNQDGMYINYDSQGTTNAHLRFYANAGNERMRIDASNGNVGIGVTNPTTRLQVANTGTITSIATIRIVGSTGNNAGSQVEFYKAQTAKAAVGLASAVVGGGTSDDLLLLSTNPASIVFNAGANGLVAFKSDGNVGIGLTNPAAARLHIKGNTTDPVLRVETALLEAGTTTSSKTFVAWLPIMTGAAVGDKVFIPLFK